jgi:acyl-CoA synthetase (AMP-forming)/AMP-acid ligase II
MSVNIGEFMSRRALITPHKEGLVCEGIRRTFSELDRRANRFANAMLRLGVGCGDRVAALALNEPEYYDMLFGLGKIGAILVPINYRLWDRDRIHRLGLRAEGLRLRKGFHRRRRFHPHRDPSKGTHRHLR